MSGNYFVNSVPGVANPDLCPTSQSVFSMQELLDDFPNKITSLGLIPDQDTNRISVSQLQPYVMELMGRNVVPSHKPVINSRVVNPETDMDRLLSDDTTFFANVRNEYCYYEARYAYALRRFLLLATSLDTGDNESARQFLNASTQLNLKLNNLLELVSYITEYRVGLINTNKDDINTSNRKINERIAELKKQYAGLSADSATINTQKEMVRYTKEKNDYVMNQITLFTVLTATALGAVLASYRFS